MLHISVYTKNSFVSARFIIVVNQIPGSQRNQLTSVSTLHECQYAVGHELARIILFFCIVSIL
jgi:hypothetical protein